MEEPLDQAAGFPSSSAASDSGSFFGIPWWAALIVLVLFMWMAREPMRRVLWQVFFITGRVFGRWGLWLGEHGKNARANCNEKIASHRADELQERMLMLEDRIGHRADGFDTGLDHGGTGGHHRIGHGNDRTTAAGGGQGEE